MCNVGTLPVEKGGSGRTKTIKKKKKKDGQSRARKPKARENFFSFSLGPRIPGSFWTRWKLGVAPPSPRFDFGALSSGAKQTCRVFFGSAVQTTSVSEHCLRGALRAGIRRVPLGLPSPTLQRKKKSVARRA